MKGKLKKILDLVEQIGSYVLHGYNYGYDKGLEIAKKRLDKKKSEDRVSESDK